QSFAQHSQLIDAIHQLILNVGDQAGLLLDSELDSSYLADVAVRQVRAMTGELGVLREWGAGIAGLKAIETEQQFKLETLVDRIEKHLRDLQRNLRVAFGAARFLEKDLTLAAAEAQSTTENFLRLTDPGLH